MRDRTRKSPPTPQPERPKWRPMGPALALIFGAILHRWQHRDVVEADDEEAATLCPIHIRWRTGVSYPTWTALKAIWRRDAAVGPRCRPVARKQPIPDRAARAASSGSRRLDSAGPRFVPTVEGGRCWANLLVINTHSH